MDGPPLGSKMSLVAALNFEGSAAERKIAISPKTDSTLLRKDSQDGQGGHATATTALTICNEILDLCVYWTHIERTITSMNVHCASIVRAKLVNFHTYSCTHKS